MACEEDPKGPHELHETFSSAMTPGDAAKAAAFMTAMDNWDRAVTTWRVYINGAAAWWGGPPPKKPGAPPLPPTYENTACQAAAKVGQQAIYDRLERELAKTFSCKGKCDTGANCLKRFTHHKGDGCSYAARMTYCVFTVRGYCACPHEELPPKPPVEA